MWRCVNLANRSISYFLSGEEKFSERGHLSALFWESSVTLPPEWAKDTEYPYTLTKLLGPALADHLCVYNFLQTDRADGFPLVDRRASPYRSKELFLKVLFFGEKLSQSNIIPIYCILGPVFLVWLSDLTRRNVLKNGLLGILPYEFIPSHYFKSLLERDDFKLLRAKIVACWHNSSLTSSEQDICFLKLETEISTTIAISPHLLMAFTMFCYLISSERRDGDAFKRDLAKFLYFYAMETAFMAKPNPIADLLEVICIGDNIRKNKRSHFQSHGELGVVFKGLIEELQRLQREGQTKPLFVSTRL